MDKRLYLLLLLVIPFALYQSVQGEIIVDVGNILWNSGTAFRATLDHAISANRVFTFPDATTTIVGTDVAQTLTSKTINADSNTVTNIENADIKAGANIDAAKIGTGVVSTTEYNYLNGVTSGIQDQINGIGGAGSGVGSFDYIVWRNTTSIYATNGTTGVIDFSGANFVTVLESAFGGLDSTRDYMQRVIVKGNFTATSTINIPSFTSLVILGKITAATGLDTTLMINDDTVGGNEYIEICCGIIDGNKAGQAGPTDADITVHASNVDNWYVHDLTVLNGWTSAIRTEFTSDCLIENNYIENSADDAIAINEETTHCTVVGNVINSTGLGVSYGAPAGIEVQDGAIGIIVTGNTVRNTSQDGIQISTHPTLDSPYNVGVVGNTITDPGSNGILVDGEADAIVSGVSLVGNSVFSAGTNGISLLYVKDLLISGNNVNGSTNNGLSDASTIGGFNTISNNVFTFNGLDGIALQTDSNDNYIVGNKLINNGWNSVEDSGIHNRGNNHIIIDNYILDSRAGTNRTQEIGIELDSVADNSTIIQNYMDNHVTTNLDDAASITPFIKRNIGLTEDEETWVVGETRTVYKSQTTSISSDGTLNDDPELFIPVGANGNYTGTIYLVYISTVGGIIAAVDGPAGTTCNFTENPAGNGILTSACATSQSAATIGTSPGFAMKYNAIWFVTGTAGDLEFQWAQSTADASTTSVIVGSLMTVTRVG